MRVLVKILIEFILILILFYLTYQRLVSGNEMPEKLLKITKEADMSQEEKIIILKSCVGMLSTLEREIKQKVDYAKEGATEHNTNLLMGGLCGLEQLSSRVRAIYDTMLFIHRL